MNNYKDMEEYTTDQVFGISRDLPINYCERTGVDNKLIRNLTRDKHLVIFGSSKQGKTCLRKHCLHEDDYITVHCSNKHDIKDLNTAILKQAGFKVAVSSSKTISGTNKINASFNVGMFGTEVGAGADSEETSEETESYKELELDPDDVNDVIAALNSIDFDKFIVLEDFHYLPVETQNDFSVALKAYHENSKYCFIIVGVWLEENRLTVYNGDLTGRVQSIDADKWSQKELKRVIEEGEKYLNIEFADSFKKDLLENCFKSVHILQEVCNLSAKKEEIYKTQEETKYIAKDIDAETLVSRVVDQNTGRFNSFLTQFSDGFQSTKLEMYKWLLYPVIQSDTDNLSKGLKQSYIRDELQKKHPEGQDLNPGNITQALQSVSALQLKKDIKPTVLDYDQTNLRLQVVDRSFLIWLDNQDRNDLCNALGLT